MPLVKAMTWILQISLSCKCFCRIYSDEVMIVYWLISLNYCLKTLLQFTAYMTINIVVLRKNILPELIEIEDRKWMMVKQNKIYRSYRRHNISNLEITLSATVQIK